tara:strand:- start:1254 stop:2192 length:939 start_codon:yes stop_codon:yes gene_type:complete
MSFFVIGSSCLDNIMYLDRIPKIGETVIGGESKKIFGGKGANQAVSAKKAGSEIKFITQLGNDQLKVELTNHLVKFGLDRKYILSDSNQPTGTAQVLVSKDGKNCIGVAYGSNGTLTFDKIKPFLDEIAYSDLVLIQLEIPMETTISIINFCYENKVKVIVNPAPAAVLPKNLLKKIWIITPNESEAEFLTGIKISNHKSAIKASKKLNQLGLKNCIITLGKNGSIWASNKGVYKFDIPSIQAIDSTAAGDVFNGYLAHSLLRNKNFFDAITKAHTAASLSVKIRGAQTSIPTNSETIVFSKTFQVKVKSVS